MSNDYYVYLLVDHDPKGKTPDDIFYVGKGRNSRALHHVLEYVHALERQEEAEALANHAAALGAAEPADQVEEHAKVLRIAELRQAGRQVRIDVLRAGLTSAVAYAVESSAIDVLGVGNLTNKVAGHEHFRAPATAVERMLTATDVPIDEPALQVTVAGLWGGASIAGLVDATDDDVVWENARQSWSLGQSRRDAIADAAQAGKPILLVAVSKGPTQLWGGIILGVWELAGTRPGGPRSHLKADGVTVETPGWEFLRIDEESDRLAALRRRWLDLPCRSTTLRQVGPVGVLL